LARSCFLLITRFSTLGKNKLWETSVKLKE
jgi:hypothetical protein